MKLRDSSVVNLPVARFVFDDLQEFVEFELLALQLGMGKDWPIAMLREFLDSWKQSHQVGDKPFSWKEAK